MGHPKRHSQAHRQPRRATSGEPRLGSKPSPKTRCWTWRGDRGMNLFLQRPQATPPPFPLKSSKCGLIRLIAEAHSFPCFHVPSDKSALTWNRGCLLNFQNLSKKSVNICERGGRAIKLFVPQCEQDKMISQMHMQG